MTRCGGCEKRIWPWQENVTIGFLAQHFSGDLVVHESYKCQSAAWDKLEADEKRLEGRGGG